MSQNLGRVLKSNDVEVEGRLMLDLEQHIPTGQNKTGGAAQSTAAKVRILENQSDYAVMEVTCSCGRKTVIRCDYGAKT